MVNFFFAGLLAWLYPLIDTDLGGGGALGLFAGFNLVAFVLVYLLVEETKLRNLEDLGQINDVPKRNFAKFQATVHFPWFLRRWLLCSIEVPPDFYYDGEN